MQKQKFDPTRLAKIEALMLAQGSHSSPDNGMCIMEAVAFVAGEKHSDQPACASPVIASFMRAWNDSLPEDQRQLLKPYVTKLVGSKSTKAIEQKRGLMAADWYLRVFTPTWLELAGLNDHAEALRTALEISSWDDVEKLQPKLSAAWSAAETAAARSAAWSAAWGAAGSAAWSAAETAAETAAGSAAWSAAGSAAWSAAGSAAEEALKPTAERLQKSAFDLLDRMLAVKK